MTNRQTIEQLQLARLNELLQEILRQNRFYQKRLGGSGESFTTLDEFRQQVDFTTKADLLADREAHPPYGSNLTYPLADYSRFCQSSGTTQSPLPWLDTSDSWSAMLDCWDKVYDAATVDQNSVIFFAFSFGPFLGFWTAYEAAVRRGNLSIPGGGLSSVARLKAMATNQCDVLCCTPTYALRLGEIRAADNSGDFDQLTISKIIVAGEPGGSIPEVREQLSQLWDGAKLFDHHGMTEVGPVTYEPADKPLSLCVIEDSYFAEVIDPKTGQEVDEGSTGELVLTTLTRKACPLLRYRTGDLVRKTYSNNQLCLEGGILGRIDEMVVIRGVNLYPSAIEKVIRSFPEITEYQVKQTTRDSMAELEILLEPTSGDLASKTLIKRVSNALHDAFALRIPVKCVTSGSLPRFEFKSKRWVKEDST